MNTSIIRKIKLSILMVMVFVMFLPLTMFADGEEVTKTASSASDINTYMQDDTTDVIKLSENITFENNVDYFSVIVYKNKKLDLNGHSITINSAYRNQITLKCKSDIKIEIIDSTKSGNSKITTSANYSSSPDLLLNLSLYQESDNNISIYIDGVNFESTRTDNMKYNSYLTGGSGKFNLTIKNSTISGISGLFYANIFESVSLSNVIIVGNNKSKNDAYLSQFSNLKVDDVIDEDSILEYVNSSSKKVKADRATTLDEIPFKDGNIVIKYPDFAVEDITFDDLTYGYSGATSKSISIKNQSGSSLAIKKVESSNTNFIVEPPSDTQSIAAGETNTSYSIKVKDGLDANTLPYTAEITVTDENDETYTATVGIKVKPKTITDLAISLPSTWTYGEEAKNPTLTGVAGLNESDYSVKYYKDDDAELSGQPKLVGKYKAVLSTGSNYSASPVSTNFEITQNTNKVAIVSGNKSFVYDGSEHESKTYSVYYADSDTALTDNKLPNGDIVIATINGKVKDVNDTKDGNNTISSVVIKNASGVDVTNCYSNIVKTNGTLTVTAITDPITVTADSDSKPYDGNVLSKNTYTYTGTLISGDSLVVIVSGEQKFVGSSNNNVTDVKVLRGDDDITLNYTINKASGTLTVTSASQVLTVADQSVIITNSITLEELKKAVSGEQCTKDELSYDISSGTGLTFDSESDSFIASSDTGEVTMTVTAAAKDIDGDSTPEYSKATKEFKINIIDKTVVTISGLANNQVFTYDGETHTPEGMITVQDNKVSVSELDISYIGTGTTTYEETATPPSDAGTYTITYKVKDNNSTYKGSVSYNFTIKKVQLTKPSLAELEKSFVYTGQDITPKITVIDSEDALINKTGGLTGKNVGDYTITISLKDKNNYEWKDDVTTDDVTLGWKITKATVTTTPSLEKTSFEYNGQNITPEISNFDEKLEEKDGDLTKKDAGNNYSITIKLKDKVNYMWSDGTTNDITLSWSITKAKVTIPSLANNTFVYTAEGDGYKPTINNQNSDLINYSGDTGYKKDVANYSIKAELKDTSNYMWNDSSSSSITLNWSIIKAPATKPTLAQISYEYSGSNITPEFNGFDDKLMQKTNDVHKINAGNYSIIIGLIDKNNYAWTDGTTGDFTINWSITKAKVTTTPSLEKTSFEYSGGDITPKINGFDNILMQATGDVTKKDAGDNYLIAIKLKDTKNYMWSDGTINDIKLSWEITKKEITKPTLTQGSFEYDKSEKTPVFSGFDDKLMDKTNEVTKINVGNYSINIGLKDENNYAWANGDSDDLTFDWSITKAIVTKPTLDENSFEYTGQEITLPTLSNYDEDIMSIVNDSNKGTIVGDYFVQVSLDDVNNYKWTDEESDSITIEWYIVPATSKIIETESTSIYYKNNGGAATIKASGVMKDFVELKIYKDDTLGYEEVDASNYTVSSGSTIIVLKESYLQTLDYDKDYKFMLVYNNNYTETYPVHILKVRKYVAPSSSSDDSTSTVVKKVVNTSSH